MRRATQPSSLSREQVHLILPRQSGWTPYHECPEMTERIQTQWVRTPKPNSKARKPGYQCLGNAGPKPGLASTIIQLSGSVWTSTVILWRDCIGKSTAKARFSNADSDPSQDGNAFTKIPPKSCTCPSTWTTSRWQETLQHSLKCGQNWENIWTSSLRYLLNKIFISDAARKISHCRKS